MELLRDRRAEFDEAGARTFGVSRDSPWTHIAWAQALDLNFPLLSDWNGDAVEAFDVAHDFNGLRGVAERSAFVVGSDCTVRGAWRYDPGELPDFDELLRAVRAS